MSGRIRVACMIDMLDRTRPSACGYLRLLLPLTKPIVADAIDVRFVAPADADTVEADIVIVQRTVLRTVEWVDALVRRVRRIGARLVFEIDDDLLSLNAGHPEYPHYAPVLPVVARLAEAADEVWTSTPALAARFAGRAVAMFPNELDPRVWRARAPAASGRVRVLFMGTRSHAIDVGAILRPAFASLRARLGAAVTLTLVGPEAFADAGVEALAPPAEVAGAYPSFAAWLLRQGDFDLGVAPLADTPFTRSKSAVKWLEYTALGAAVVASSAGAYPDAVDGDGLVVAPTMEAFRDALASLATDPETLHGMRVRAHQRASAMLSAAAEHEPRIERLMALATQTPASRPVAAAS